MDNVGYTMGDEFLVSYYDMKIKALRHCLAGGQFICSWGGDRFVPNFENPSLLTWLFPHLYLWGIGRFHESLWEIPIMMEEQVKYLLELNKSPFKWDLDFTFIYYNILQKKAVCESVCFRVKAVEQGCITQELLSVDCRDLEHLIARFKGNLWYEPQSPKELHVVSLVNRVSTMFHKLPGTAGYKLKMQNEICTLINRWGMPAFFYHTEPVWCQIPLGEATGRRQYLHGVPWDWSRTDGMGSDETSYQETSSMCAALPQNDF